jgi:hypothetical protein
LAAALLAGNDEFDLEQIRAILDEGVPEEEASPLGNPVPRVVPDYAAVKRDPRRHSLSWARTASQPELETAAADLLDEIDADRLAGYLRIFWYRPFPGPADRLLELARSGQRVLSHSALNALKQLSDQRIRALGLELRDAGLLVRNSAAGDYHILEHWLTEAADADACHKLGIDIRHYAKAHRSEEASASLFRLYEKGPCSLCRHDVVEQLIALGRFPEWMREECRYDSYLETRKLASPAS